MIAANDPQEFIPGGRQQALRHPDPPELSASNHHVEFRDDFLLRRLEKVKLDENAAAEWWVLRKSTKLSSPASLKQKTKCPETADKEATKFNNSTGKSQMDFLFEDSWCSNHFEQSNKKRVSDANTFFQSKRFSNESERSDLKGSTPKLNSQSTATGRYPLRLRAAQDSVEEELYVKGNLVIWSCGLAYNDEEHARTVICSYSSCFPLKHAIWCSFRMETPQYKDAEIIEGEPLDCLCIADAQNLRIYTKYDDDFITTLPFRAKKLWATKFGVIIEREDCDLSKETKSTMFFLTHPLDIFTPMAFSRSGLVKMIDTNALQVVFTAETMEICMVYDKDHRQHIICRLRRITENEFDHLSKTSIHPSHSTTRNHTPFSFMDSNRSFPLQHLTNPFESRPASVTSNHMGPAGSLALSRCQTPSGSLLTKQPSYASSPWMLSQRLSRLQSTIRSFDSSLRNRLSTLDMSNSHSVAAEPMFCLEYLWAESLPEGCVNTPTHNVFITEDFLGQSYLCYVVATRPQLSLVKFDFLNNSNDLVFGKALTISAKDAVPVPHLHMLAVLEHTGIVLLYSGNSIVGKLHVGGTLTQHVPSPLTIRKNSKQFFNSPYPRRSSLIPTSTPVDPRFDEHLLSPVLPAMPVNRNMNIIQVPEIADTSRVFLSGLRDPIDNRITLQYSDGSHYRISLPPIVNSPLIEDCLNAFRITLPKDIAIMILARWYSYRNSPGADDSGQPEEWKMFTKFMLEMLGYDLTTVADSSTQMELATPSSNQQVKRQKQNPDGSQSDWVQVLKQPEVRDCFNCINDYLSLQPSSTTLGEMFLEHSPDTLHVNTSAVLFPHIRIIHYVLHLIYEDLKLNILRKNDLLLMAQFLAQLSSDMNLEHYVMHYWRDFPHLLPIYDAHKEQISGCDLNAIIKWPDIPEQPTNILEFLHGLCKGDNMHKFPVITNVNMRSRNVVHLMAQYLIDDFKGEEEIIAIIAPPGGRHKIQSGNPSTKTYISDLSTVTGAHKVVLTLVGLNITTRDLETYPLAVNFILHDALWICRAKPPTDWPPEAYNLLRRNDLAYQANIVSLLDPKAPKSKYNIEEMSKVLHPPDGASTDCSEELMKLRFATDQRVMEARRLLQSSQPVTVAILQRPDVSDHDFIEEQEKHLYAICTRTMALPVGRGMFTMHTMTPLLTEPLPIPPLCLTGKALPRGTTVELTHIDIPSNMSHWPQFHNGVANGLRIMPNAKNVDSTWIVFNKPRNANETLMEHAGFLMGLGLNGHLKNLEQLNRFDYMSKFHEITSVGIILGLGAAFRATGNIAVTKMLSVHVESLLPPTSIELDVPQNLQVASLLSLGLIFQGTAHRRMIEVMLTEIGRPPGPEMENSVDRQSYSLSAGLALGLMTLRQGGRMPGLSDLNISDTLHYYMVGGAKRPLQGSQKEKYKVPSFQIREGSSVNLDVTAPGATLALGLMYLGTGNEAIAGWMAPPDTQYLLDFVRPDFLILRTLSRALILWKDISPEKAWIEKQVPNTVRPYCMVEPNPHIDLDYEAMNQAYCNIVSGACFALGLKFAGSADPDVFEVLLNYCHMFTSLTSKSIAELAGKPTIETCLNVVLLSSAMVMAGTGNLEILRIVRYLRRRVGLSSSAVVTYGSHLAMHMALGLLFLGGGRYTLSNSPTSVAALICALYPKFPTHSNDNRYHLQAFRHLYVLAAEPRVIIPIDIVSQAMCYANVNVIKLDGTTISIKAPALIPDLNTLYKITIQDQRYWPVTFERGRNWEQLRTILSTCSNIDVKQRAGCLSHIEDKTGFRSDLARTLTQSEVVPWDPQASSIIAFSSDAIVKLFCDHFLQNEHSSMDATWMLNETRGSDEEEAQEAKETIRSNGEAKLQQALSQISYESVVQDKLSVLHLLVHLILIVKNLETTTTPYDIWNLKIICALALCRRASVLASKEFLLSLHQRAVNVVDNWEPKLRKSLKSYILRNAMSDAEHLHDLGKYIAFYHLPYGVHPENNDILNLIWNLQGMACDSRVMDNVLRILGFVQ